MTTPNIPEKNLPLEKELPKAPETQTEKIIPRESAPSKPENEKIDTKTSTPEGSRFGSSLRRKPTTVPQAQDEITVKIEKIMEEGMGDAFSRMSPVAKQEFKIKGEETARKIRSLMKGTKVKAKKIFNLILQWLKLLPGVNRFFLEQEAKIKTDRIIHLKKTQEGLIKL
ncbi:MAG TPA: hypothetical protein VJH75_03455 [Patescibacteria group bacterium]|nr:hypothetical protein [Patescibacteria group bacterium]